MNQMSELAPGFKNKYRFCEILFWFYISMYMCTVLQSKMCLLFWVMIKSSHCFCPQGIETQGAHLNAIFQLLKFNSFLQFTSLRREQSIQLTHYFSKQPLPSKSSYCSRNSRNTIQDGRFNKRHSLIDVQGREQLILPGQFPKKCVYSQI